SYVKKDNGTYNVKVLPRGGSAEWSRAVVPQGIEADKLPDYVGKEVAQRIIDGSGERLRTGETMLSGLDLKVGGEGMRAFYNKIVPSVAKDVLKKLGGGAMETVAVSVGNKPANPEALQFQIDHPEIYNAETRRLAAQELAGKTADQPGFTITDTMRDKALGGMPLFSRSADNGSAETRFSRASAGVADALRGLNDVKLPADYLVSDFVSSHGKLSWWHKTVGSMHNLAERNPLFKPVYDAAQNFLNDVSTYATEAADLAPTLLPKLEGLRDLAKSPLSAEDTKAISAPIFQGTLSWTRDENGQPVPEADPQKAGIVWTDGELIGRFGLDEKQRGLYHEFRKSVDKSLTDLAVSDMIRFGGKDVEAVAPQARNAATVNDARNILTGHLASLAEAQPDRAGVLLDTGAKIGDKAGHAHEMMRKGYAPLTRFGHYTLDVVDEDGSRVYFGLFESQADASRFARKLKADYPNAEFNQGTMSDEAYKMFSGVSPETLEVFGQMLGLEAEGNDARSQAFQEYLKLTKSNRSAMKRLIERKGVAGFSEDAGRVLAGFVYSNARQASKNMNMAAMTASVQDVADRKGQGELLDTAVKLHQYITNPQDEAPALKGLLFAQFLGGSIAAGLVNLTQPVMVTFPYLSQYGGAAKAAGQMKSAMADAVKWAKGDGTGDAQLDAALKRAEEEGIVSPQEVHSLMAQARGAGALKAGDGTTMGNAMAKGSNFLSKLTLLWGRPFALAEQYNRQVTFIAAFRTAVAAGMASPAKFAEKAVNETQFTYTKANRPEWARGAIGSTLFTFKTYSISYVELLTRMAKSGPEGRKAALLGLGTLFLMSGLQGLPGADDLDDLIDGALQRMGYNFSSKMKKRQFFASMFGEGGASFLMRGASGLPGMPLDVAGRLGLGNLIPGTGLFTKRTDHTQDVAELFGPAGSLFKQGLTAADKLTQGDVGGAVTAMLPVAAQNAVKAAEWHRPACTATRAGAR
nr:PLxRFG domain-containing protein [Burkholderiaceae bacterium]